MGGCGRRWVEGRHFVCGSEICKPRNRPECEIKLHPSFGPTRSYIIRLIFEPRGVRPGHTQRGVGGCPPPLWGWGQRQSLELNGRFLFDPFVRLVCTPHIIIPPFLTLQSGRSDRWLTLRFLMQRPTTMSFVLHRAQPITPLWHHPIRLQRGGAPVRPTPTQPGEGGPRGAGGIPANPKKGVKKGDIRHFPTTKKLPVTATLLAGVVCWYLQTSLFFEGADQFVRLRHTPRDPPPFMPLWGCGEPKGGR